MFFFCSRIKMQYDHIVATISQLKVTRPSFFFGGGEYHPTLKLSGISTFTTTTNT